MPLNIGDVIEGKYRIIRPIGEGGMGAVYEGHHERINRRVAIKVLHQAYTTSDEAVQRFEREAQAAGRIGSDHILEIIDIGALPDGDRFMVMEFLDGQPLTARIQENGRLTPQQTAPLAKQLLRGLAAAHAAGIVHRDLKPDNVFILKEKAGVPDYVKIIDFGISKFQPLSGDGMKMTRTGAVMGTPYYMSPEQASGSREADARSDLYSVGVILYEAVTGRVPFDAQTFNQLMFKIVLEEVPPPQTLVPDLDPAFTSIILKAMARDVSRRFQTAAELSEAIDAWMLRGSSVSIPPPEVAGFVPGAGATQAVPVTSQPGTDPGLSGPAGTRANWATSQGVEAPQKRSVVPIVAAVAGAGVLALGVGALALFLVFGRASSANTPASAAVELTPPPSAALAAAPPSAPMAPTPDVPSAPASQSAVASASTAEATSPPAPAPAGNPNVAGRPAVREAAPRTPPREAAPASPPRAPAKPAGPVDFGY